GSLRFHSFGVYLLMARLLSFLLFIVISLSSCSNKYKVFSENYQFKSADGAPHYNDLNYWAAHPWKWDPSDSIPAPLKGEGKDSTVDVFFLHPTTFTQKKFKRVANARIDDDLLNAKTDYTSMLYQASVFNGEARVFAPRYRQAHIINFFKPDIKTAAALDLAYEDVKTSFEYYLKTWNKGRPVIIASHSQGSFLAERLLKEFFEGTKLKNKLVAAYLPGWPVPKDYFTSLKMCEDSLQTGCLCSWRTFRKGYVPFYLKKENGNSYVTNPITWITTEGSYAARELNKGSVLKNFNRVYPFTTDARVSNGLLYVRKPKFPWSFLYIKRNYHIADINLYYINLRENVSRRIAMYWKQ
ncbi:MAG TPA: DUF3089 domain-containing protein, partial [Chitinophagaceae bacterium]|nr:DUF3089 domain-containing protein [Chitinophagaceae bacterium]